VPGPSTAPSLDLTSVRDILSSPLGKLRGGGCAWESVARVESECVARVQRERERERGREGGRERDMNTRKVMTILAQGVVSS